MSQHRTQKFDPLRPFCFLCLFSGVRALVQTLLELGTKPSRCLIRCKQELVCGCLLKLRELCSLFVSLEDPTRRLQVGDTRCSDVLPVCCKICCLCLLEALWKDSVADHRVVENQEVRRFLWETTQRSHLSGLWLFLESQHRKLSVTSSLLQLRPKLWWSVLLPSSYQPFKPACAEGVLLMNLSRTSWPYPLESVAQPD